MGKDLIAVQLSIQSHAFLLGTSPGAAVGGGRLEQARSKGAQAKIPSAVNNARRSGAEVDTEKKFAGGMNKSPQSVVSNAKKLDEHHETFHHPTVSHEFKLALQQARLAKKMSQQQLAQAINEKGSVINDYESGKAIPNGAVIQKLNRVMGVRLPKTK